MFLRGGQFYYRKTVPQDVFRLIGKAEIWRSLRTDSFQIAAHRLPMVMANIESQIENVRLKAGFQCDHYLLKGLNNLDIIESEKSSESLSLVSQRRDDQPASPSLTLGEAYQRYMDDPTHTWSVRTREA
ncbi:DUF6538 domain-containing protein [Novosphingobium acidiphilum]|uniref:DUF6538 domain-containing protein n=1 Tax=Novosphingobium acidiphilum TaxID=505248 RepID=UPI00048F408F